MYATQQRRPSANSHDSEKSFPNQIACASEECIRDYPVSSTMVAFGAGAAIGLLIASSMYSREEEKRSYFTQLGHQLANSMGNSFPDALWRKS